jgi:WD repeat-containing protein 61
MIEVKRKHVFTGHKGPVYTITESGIDGVILSGSSDQLMGSWSIVNGTPGEISAYMPTHIIALAGLKNPHRIVAGTSGGTVHVIDPVAKKELRADKHFSSQVFEFAYAEKHNLLLTSSGDGAIAVLDGVSFDKLKTLQICNEKVRSMAVHPSGDLLAVASSDGMIRIFSLPLMKEVKQFSAHEPAANVVAWNPKGNLLLSGGRDAHLKIWNADDNYSLMNDIAAHNYAIYSIAYSPDGKYFATGSRDKTVKVWNAETFEVLVRINKEKHDAHLNSVNKVLWNDYGLISTGDDRAIMVWEISEQIS